MGDAPASRATSRASAARRTTADAWPGSTIQVPLTMPPVAPTRESSQQPQKLEDGEKAQQGQQEGERPPGEVRSDECICWEIAFCCCIVCCDPGGGGGGGGGR